MKAGPKAAPKGEPLDLSFLPSGPEAVPTFVEEFLRLPKGPDARSFVRLRTWQRSLLLGMFDGRPRQGLVSVGRKNSKSFLAACAAVYGLLGDVAQGEGREVLLVAGDERQARIVFDLARRMIELEPRLAGVVQMFQNRIVHPESDSVMEFLPADGDRLQGRNPTLAVVDEVHVVKEPTWTAMTLAGGTRPYPLTLGITTAGDDPESLLWRLVEHGRTGGDPSFFFREWSAPDGCALDDENAWREANPALGDFLAIDHLRSVVKTTREPVFRRFHLNQWTADDSAWMPVSAWSSRGAPAMVVADATEVVLGFDGSYSGDSTALVGCTIGANPHLFVVGVWENPKDERWRVPRAEVDAAVGAAFDRYKVRRLVADPFGWRSELEAWEARYGDEVVLEWPSNSLPRMAPATDRLRTAVIEGQMTHDGDARLAAHIAHCRAKNTTYGDVVTKDRRGSPRKIDLAVASILAFDAAAHVRPQSRRRAGAF